MDDRTAWLTATAALLGPVGVLLGRWWDRRDVKDKTTLDWRERRETALYDRQDRQLERAHKRIADLEAEVDRVEADRDKGWTVARAWHGKAHEINRALEEASHSLPEDKRPPPVSLPRLTAIDCKKDQPPA